MKPTYTRRCLLLVLPFALYAFDSYSLAQGQVPPSGDGASYVVFDVPNAVSTKVVGINNSGEVTGYFQDSPSGGTRGFVREPNGDITVFGGIPAAINDPGDVAGVNFLRDAHGNITEFDIPLSTTVIRVGFTMAIDNRGDITGFFIPCLGCGTWEGFVRHRQGDITTFVSGSTGSVPTCINERGDIAGTTSPYYLSQEGFVRDRKGVMTVFDAGGSGPGPRAYPVGINNRGDITGYFYDSQSNATRGFLRDSKGNITVFDGMPAAINDADEIAGDFSDATGDHNFLRDNKGNVTVFNVPNNSGAHAVSINNRGDVAGYFLDATTGKTRGFVRIANP